MAWTQLDQLSPSTQVKVKKRVSPRARRNQMYDAGIPSIPGRTARSKAIYLLQIAAEVEHALMAQYLYAAYSLDEAFARGKVNETTRFVDRWKRDIRLIARQEMAHLATVQNLLIALGAEVYVNRENNFSEHPDTYPFPVKFEKVSLISLARYVAAESPAPEGLDAKTGRDLLEIFRLAGGKVKQKVNRVGALYAAIYWLFQRDDTHGGPWKMPLPLTRWMKAANLAGVHVKDNDFAHPRDYEEFAARPGEWEVYDDSLHIADTDPRSQALRAIKWIMLQGEGPATSNASNDSHFYRFYGIFNDLRENPALLAAARSVPLNPVVRNRHRTEPVQPGADCITHPESRLWAQLFNFRYQMLLLDVLLALSTSRFDNPRLRSSLTQWAGRHEMEHLKQIGQLLPALPRHFRSKRLRAGAPFEIVAFPLEYAKRWDQQRVLMKGSAELVKKLKTMVSPRDQRFAILRTIANFDHGRKEIVDGLFHLTSKYHWKDGRNQRFGS